VTSSDAVAGSNQSVVHVMHSFRNYDTLLLMHAATTRVWQRLVKTRSQRSRCSSSSSSSSNRHIPCACESKPVNYSVNSLSLLINRGTPSARCHRVLLISNNIYRHRSETAQGNSIESRSIYIHCTVHQTTSHEIES
jgi:hypothetical protein